MAYHPADKTFGTFSGVNMTVEGVALKATTTEASKPAKPKGTLPKGFEDAPKIDAPQNDTSDGKSKQDQLSEYEDDYLKRLEQQKIDDAKAAADAAKQKLQQKHLQIKKVVHYQKDLKQKLHQNLLKNLEAHYQKVSNLFFLFLFCKFFIL